MTDESTVPILRDALAAVVTGNVDALRDCFAEDVAGWSPNLTVTCRAELAAAVADHDDALSDIELLIDAIDVIGHKAIAEWRVEAMFTGAFLLDDDILLEPTGQPVALAGCTVAEFANGRIQTFRSYFDEAALLEQMLVTR